LLLVLRATSYLIVQKKHSEKKCCSISFVRPNSVLSSCAQIEAEVRRTELEQSLDRCLLEYDWKIAAIDEIIELAKGKLEPDWGSIT